MGLSPRERDNAVKTNWLGVQPTGSNSSSRWRLGTQKGGAMSGRSGAEGDRIEGFDESEEDVSQAALDEIRTMSTAATSSDGYEKGGVKANSKARSRRTPSPSPALLNGSSPQFQMLSASYGSLREQPSSPQLSQLSASLNSTESGNQQRGKSLSASFGASDRPQSGATTHTGLTMLTAETGASTSIDSSLSASHSFSGSRVSSGGMGRGGGGSGDEEMSGCDSGGVVNRKKKKGKASKTATVTNSEWSDKWMLDDDDDDDDPLDRTRKNEKTKTGDGGPIIKPEITSFLCIYPQHIFLIGRSDGVVQLLTFETKERWERRAHRRSVTAIHMDSYHRVWTGGDDGVLCMFELRSKKLTLRKRWHAHEHSPRTICAITSIPRMKPYSVDPHENPFPALVTAGADGCIHVRDVTNVNVEREMCVEKRHERAINVLKLIDKNQIVTAGDDGVIYFLDAFSLEVNRSFLASMSPVTCCSVDVETNMMATGSLDAIIRIWSLSTLQLLWSMQYSNPITCVEICHVPPSVFAGTVNGSIVTTGIPQKLFSPIFKHRFDRPEDEVLPGEKPKIEEINSDDEEDVLLGEVQATRQKGSEDESSESRKSSPDEFDEDEDEEDDDNEDQEKSANGESDTLSDGLFDFRATKKDTGSSPVGGASKSADARTDSSKTDLQKSVSPAASPSPSPSVRPSVLKPLPLPKSKGTTIL